MEKRPWSSTPMPSPDPEGVVAWGMSFTSSSYSTFSSRMMAWKMPWMGEKRGESLDRDVGPCPWQ